MQEIDEVKIHKNKETQRFRCRVLQRSADSIVLYYRSSEQATVSDTVIPRGSVTLAHYWTGRQYVLWRMFDPCGVLLGTLFHICRAVTISDTEVTYIDLVVDIWISPDGRLRVLDEDELADCAEKNLVSGQEMDLIDKQKELIKQQHKDILDEIMFMEAKLIETLQ